MIGILTNRTADFMMRLRKIDRAALTCRDMLCLFTIINNPGISGIDMAGMVGVEHRSNIASNIHRLVRMGFIEDRRVISRKATPSLLYALPPGIAFWNELKP